MRSRILLFAMIALLLVSLPASALATMPAQSEGSPLVTLDVTAAVYAWPDDNATVIGHIPARYVVPVTGRTVDSAWWQIPHPDGPSGHAWLPASDVTANDKAATVTVIQVIIPEPEPAPVVPTPVPTPIPQTCIVNAAFVADVTVPDGTQVQPTQAVNKVWRMRNTGTCTWDSDTVLNFVGGNQMSAPPLVNLPLTQPGGTVDVAVTAYAPAANGVFRSVWQLQYQPTGALFGPRVTLVIRVGNPAPPPQPTRVPPPPPTPVPSPEAGLDSFLGRPHVAQVRQVHDDSLGRAERVEGRVQRRQVEGCRRAGQQERLPEESEDLQAESDRSREPHARAPGAYRRGLQAGAEPEPI